MSDVRTWLAGIGFGQHADAFEANAHESPRTTKLYAERKKGLRKTKYTPLRSEPENPWAR
jgi:hypothetical protein